MSLRIGLTPVSVQRITAARRRGFENGGRWLGQTLRTLSASLAAIQLAPSLQDHCCGQLVGLVFIRAPTLKSVSFAAVSRYGPRRQMGRCRRQQESMVPERC